MRSNREQLVFLAIVMQIETNCLHANRQQLEKEKWHPRISEKSEDATHYNFSLSATSFHSLSVL